MVSHLLETHALGGVRHQDLLAEVLRFVAQRVEWTHCVIRFLQVQVRDVRVCVIFIFTSEGCLSGQQFKS